jgi:hypothetical protein
MCRTNPYLREARHPARQILSERVRLQSAANPKSRMPRPDGKRIAALMPADAQEARSEQDRIILLETLFDELRRRMPAGK